MKEQFILNWTGNKYDELKKNKVIDKETIEKYDTIIEPFGGSFGFIRYVYYVLGVKDKKFIVYDSDKELIDFYNYYKETDKEKFLIEYNEIMDKIVEISEYRTALNYKVINKKIAFPYIESNIKNKYMLYCLKLNMGLRRFCKANYKKNMVYNDLMEKITFIYKPFLDVNFDKYNKIKTYIFFDPPYLGCDNSIYKDRDVYSLLDKIYDIMDNYSTMFIHIKNETIDEIFNLFLHQSYSKYYNLRKTHISHNVFISNP